MADWYQGYSPDTTDKDATRLFEQKFGYLPFALRRDPSSVQVGPVGKRQYVVGDKITHNGQTYTVAEVEKTLAGYTILATLENRTGSKVLVSLAGLSPRERQIG